MVIAITLIPIIPKLVDTMVEIVFIKLIIINVFHNLKFYNLQTSDLCWFVFVNNSMHVSGITPHHHGFFSLLIDWLIRDSFMHSHPHLLQFSFSPISHHITSHHITSKIRRINWIRINEWIERNKVLDHQCTRAIMHHYFLSLFHTVHTTSRV